MPSPVPGKALTYPEARERSRLIEVLGYRVELDLSGDGSAFGSVTVVRFRCLEPGAASFIELRPYRLHRVVLNGRDVDPGTLRGNRLPLADLRADNELRVEADMPYSRAGAGMHRFTDAADGETYLAVHAGLDHAQLVFAAFDQPDLKAPIAAAVVAPASWTVIGNGVATPAGSQEPIRAPGGRKGPRGSRGLKGSGGLRGLGGSGGLRGLGGSGGLGGLGGPGPARWELAATPPISTYLFALAAGPFHSIRAEHRGIGFGLHSRRSLAAHLHRDADEILAITRACFDRYQQIFAEPYPFDSYDQVFVPELEAGATENPGCITFRDEFLFPSAVTRAERQIRGVVIAHEMAHMWFGDLVTMRWWNDVWLSESFAEYMGFRVLSEATGFTAAWAECALTRKPRGYDADQRASTHPVAPGPREVPDTDAARSSYDDISYAKGAAALRQLVAWMGWPAFAAGLNDYLTRHRFGSATLADLIDCLSRASGADVDDWAARWLRSAGVDTIAVDRNASAQGGGQIRHAGSRPHRVWIGVYDRTGDADSLALRARFPVSVGADAGEAALPREALDPPPALLLPNDGDFSYCKVRLDPQSLAALVSSLGRLADPLGRAVAWNAARDLVRDGELPAWSYLQLATRHLPAETDTSIAGQVLGYARWTVADRYLPRRLRGAALEQLAGLCRRLLGQPAVGGMRLVAARGLIDSASTPDEAGALSSWLAAGRWPGGPDLDPSDPLSALDPSGPPDPSAPLDSRLRWQIMLRLTVLGAVGRAEIEREAARDPTAAGQQSAARCHAAIPASDAKQAAWAVMFGPGRDGGPSSYQLAATADGFWQADQADLLAGYVPRYFPALAEAAARRGASAARVLCQHGFPHHAVDAATLRAGEKCLAGADLSASLRRLLADQLEDLHRAIKVSSRPVPDQAGPGPPEARPSRRS